MSRLFEKTIRRKKPSPMLLEWITHSVMLVIIILLVIAAYFIFIEGDYFLTRKYNGVAFGVLFELYVIDQILWFRLTYRLFNSSFNSFLVGKNIIFVDQKKHSIELFCNTFLYLYLTEPYIYRVCFLMDGYQGERYSSTWEKLHFNLPISKTFKWKKDFSKYEMMYLSDGRKTNPNYKSSRFRNYNYQRKQGNCDWSKYSYYITYEKAQALNRLFDIVELPAFRIVVNEDTKMLLEIHPIEGRDYPEEAYGLLEKINSLYP